MPGPGRCLLNGCSASVIPDILAAVRYHTTGRAEMSRLETVLYLADFTSSDRDYPDVDVLRRLSDEDLDRAMAYALSYTIRDLVERTARYIRIPWPATTMSSSASTPTNGWRNGRYPISSERRQRPGGGYTKMKACGARPTERTGFHYGER